MTCDTISFAIQIGDPLMGSTGVSFHVPRHKDTQEMQAFHLCSMFCDQPISCGGRLISNCRRTSGSSRPHIPRHGSLSRRTSLLASPNFPKKSSANPATAPPLPVLPPPPPSSRFHGHPERRERHPDFWKDIPASTTAAAATMFAGKLVQACRLDPFDLGLRTRHTRLTVDTSRNPR